ncbi:MAG: FtsQ-type POTRA domain-containing protein [Firmicutes bacterium]|nr:FtsQ-type POTRA domain-containing protein [Bacillota bacterium]
MNEEQYDDMELKQVDRQRKVHKRKNYLLRFLIFAAICAGIWFFLNSDYFAVKEYTVEGNSYYTGDEILSMAKARPGNNIIFHSGIPEIRERLEADPYFREVSVKRKLPDKIVISVVERPQVAGVIYGENYVIIDDEGVVLRRTDVDPELTLLTGLTISKMNLGEKIECEEADTLSMTLRMLASMREGDIFFKQIDVSDVLIHAYIYDSLIVKGTPGEMMKSIDGGELQKVVNRLFEEGISRGTIKMGGEDYMSFTPEIETD